MKIQIFLAALSLSLPLALAEPKADPPPGLPPAPQKKMRDAVRDRMMNKLSPEDRARFEAARKKALEDPSISSLREQAESSNRAFFDAMKARMNEIDPGLKDILQKQAGENKERPKAEKRRETPRKGSDDKGFGSLDQADRDRLQAAREIAKQTPAVQAAEQKQTAAKTAEEREAAGTEYAKAMREAMLQADPSLADILDKIRPPGRPAKKDDAPTMETMEN